MPSAAMYLAYQRQSVLTNKKQLNEKCFNRTRQ